MIIYALCFLHVLLTPVPVGFNYDVWTDGLTGYYDSDFVFEAISDGVDIGLLPDFQPTPVENPYIPVSDDQKLALTYQLVKWNAAGILLGPFLPHNCPFKNLYFAPLFAVPKPDGLWRTVAHLSYPRWGISVNDCLDKDAKRVTYITFAELAHFVYSLGVGAYLWVVDAKDAYYRVPVKKKYWRYMAIKWFGYIFIFTSLQMGLGTACALYQRFADAILYIIRTKNAALFWHAGLGSYLIYHYLDDFFGGNSNYDDALDQMQVTYDWFHKLGIPTQGKKLKYPHWRQLILGWIWDTRAQTVSLPDYKVRAYSTHITRLIRQRQKGTDRKELERLNGRLGHAAVAIYCG